MDHHLLQLACFRGPVCVRYGCASLQMWPYLRSRWQYGQARRQSVPAPYMGVWAFEIAVRATTCIDGNTTRQLVGCARGMAWFALDMGVCGWTVGARSFRDGTTIRELVGCARGRGLHYVSASVVGGRWQ